MNVTLLAFPFLGFVCIIAALIGGNVKVGGIEFKSIKSLRIRLLLGVAGAALVASWGFLALYTENRPQSPVEAAPPSFPQASTVEPAPSPELSPTKPHQTRQNTTDPSRSAAPDRQSGSGTLPAEEAREAIMQALHAGRLKDAEGLLSKLTPGSAKEEECEHVYDFARDNQDLADADNVVNLCWSGKVKQDKLDEIQHVKLKQSEGEVR